MLDHRDFNAFPLSLINENVRSHGVHPLPRVLFALCGRNKVNTVLGETHGATELARPIPEPSRRIAPLRLFSDNQNFELAAFGGGEEQLMRFAIKRHGLCPGYGLDGFHYGIFVRRVLMNHGDRAFTI